MPKGKKSRSSAKTQVAQPPLKTRTAQKKTVTNPPTKTARLQANAAANTPGQKRKRAESTGLPQEKRCKTHPLTAADIPDIVMAVVKVMPQPTDTSMTLSSRRSSSRRAKNTNQLGDQPNPGSRCSVTLLTANAETKESSDDEDADNKNFGKSRGNLCIIYFICKSKKLKNLMPIPPFLLMRITLIFPVINVHHL